MPQPKHPLGYPGNFFELARIAMVKPVVLEFKTEGEALSFVMKWGAFRKALREHPEVDEVLSNAVFALPAFRPKRGRIVTVKQADYHADEINTALARAMNEEI